MLFCLLFLITLVFVAITCCVGFVCGFVVVIVLWCCLFALLAGFMLFTWMICFMCVVIVYLCCSLIEIWFPGYVDGFWLFATFVGFYVFVSVICFLVLLCLVSSLAWFLGVLLFSFEVVLLVWWCLLWLLNFWLFVCLLWWCWFWFGLGVWGWLAVFYLSVLYCGCYLFRLLIVLHVWFYFFCV